MFFQAKCTSAPSPLPLPHCRAAPMCWSRLRTHFCARQGPPAMLQCSRSPACCGPRLVPAACALLHGSRGVAVPFGHQCGAGLGLRRCCPASRAGPSSLGLGLPLSLSHLLHACQLATSRRRAALLLLLLLLSRLLQGDEVGPDVGRGPQVRAMQRTRGGSVQVLLCCRSRQAGGQCAPRKQDQPNQPPPTHLRVREGSAHPGQKVGVGPARAQPLQQGSRQQMS